ncbi:MAG: sigma-54-dependent Fis family transcriptional regulator [Candidatus Cloacimonetes bacterium]|nr:sigma-54-dependent Fis family transcriptional regulator [Candidatus Cloacimonadota bacterium]
MLDNKNLRNIVKQSWQRCRDQKLDPKKYSPNILKNAELQKLKMETAQLNEFTIPYMRRIFSVIRESECVLVLADKNGYIIESVGFEGYLDKVPIAKPGTSWNEKDLGTNGIGTALVVKLPVQISGTEHFLEMNHQYTCSAAPIRNPEGEIIACLDITGKTELMHSHSLAMIVSAVDAIEKYLVTKRIYEDKIRIAEQNQIILNMINDGIIVLNSELLFVSMNENARKMLKTKDNLLGKEFSEVINCSLDLNGMLRENVAITDEETVFVLNNNKLRLLVSTSVFRNANQENEGVILTLRESEKMNRIVNKITGSKALITLDDIIGESPVMQDCKYFARICSKSKSNVLLLGESGTGKEMFAQSIHNLSDRRSKPFIAVNCGALPRELIQSELFGYAGGAFTGSRKEGHAGKFELADGGTIFLDEIGDMPLDAQVNLLRVLQQGEVTRVGGKFPQKVDVRIIAATNRNLMELVQENSFRDDLYYRLNVMCIEIPPLRERQEDIRNLIDFFVQKFSTSLDKKITNVSSSFYEVLLEYGWPGNIRELENVIERAVNVMEKDVLGIKDLPYNILKSKKVESPEKQKKAPLLRMKEAELIKNTLEQTGGNMRQAALQLGISRGTLYEKIKKHKLIIKDFRNMS